MFRPAPVTPRPLLSICIPSYNGSKHIGHLVSSLLTRKRTNFEVVISDDCSSDDSWDKIKLWARSDPRLRCARNSINFGMDRNFAHSVSLARGDYVWLCGQDDLIRMDGLERILDFLLGHPEIDFVLLNHTKRELGRMGEKLIEAPCFANHIYGTGLTSFVEHFAHRLPTFLPTFLMRTGHWRNSDVSRYFGTCYCQVGVFLEQSKSMHWCHFAGNFVVGLLPRDGWQSNPSAYVKIALGHFAMLGRAHEQAPWITPGMLDRFFQLQKRRLIYSFLLLKKHQIEVDPTILNEALEAISPFRKISKPVELVQRLPRILCSATLGFIALRRALRKLSG